ncbi:uncharacterized protein DS421_1g15090 [Arachis hypogaea]|nr:uncharacterized protein DS421_1g15090 [Arachis hypogaea]
MEEYSCLSIQEPYDPNHVIQAEQESRDHLKEVLDQFQATMERVVQQVEKVENVELPHYYYNEPSSYYEPSLQNNEPLHPPQSLMDETLGVLLHGQDGMKWDVQQFVVVLAEVVNRLASQCLDTQGTPMATYGESNEKPSMRERLDTPVENVEYYFVLEQLEEPMTIEEEEEVVEDLGDAEPPWEPRVEETSPRRLNMMSRRNVHNLQGISRMRRFSQTPPTRTRALRVRVDCLPSSHFFSSLLFISFLLFSSSLLLLLIQHF